jgi:hypothetical protein
VVGVGEAGEIGPCALSKPRDISSISLHHVSTRTTDARARRYTLVLCLALLIGFLQLTRQMRCCSLG